MSRDQKQSAKINAIRKAAGNLMKSCPTCGKSELQPYRRIVAGKVTEGCVDAFHAVVGLYPSTSAEWHNRPYAVKLRANVLRGLFK